MTTSSVNLENVYQAVIDDVVENIQKVFENEGLEEHVLQDLRHLWEMKILQSGAVGTRQAEDENSYRASHPSRRAQVPDGDANPYDDDLYQQNDNPYNGTGYNNNNKSKKSSTTDTTPTPTTTSMSSSSNPDSNPYEEDGGDTDDPYAENIQQTDGCSDFKVVDEKVASGIVVDKVKYNTAYNTTTATATATAFNIEIIPQTDGLEDLSDSEDDDENEDSLFKGNDDQKNEDDPNGNENKLGDDNDELGSDLDDSDSDNEITDTLLCLYDKVTRKGSKWKVTLRNGIMSIRGRDYAFSKLMGELHW